MPALFGDAHPLLSWALKQTTAEHVRPTWGAIECGTGQKLGDTLRGDLVGIAAVTAMAAVVAVTIRLLRNLDAFSLDVVDETGDTQAEVSVEPAEAANVSDGTGG